MSRSVDGAPPASARLRVALGVLLLQLPFGLVFAWGTVVPQALRDGWAPVLTGAVFSATPLGYGSGTILGGRLGDKVPPRRLCWVAVGLLAAGFMAAFTWPSGIAFVAFYGFLALGVGGGLALTGGVAALGAAFPRHRGAVAGATTATYAASSILQAPIVGTLIPGMGWTRALALVGAATTLLAVAGLAGLPSLPASRAPGAAAGPSFKSLITRPLLWSGVLVMFAATTFGPSAAVNVAVAVRAQGLGAGIATGAVVLVATGNTAARLTAGWASDHFGVDRLMAAVLGLELIGALLLLLASSWIPLLGGALAGGLALGGAGLVGRMAAEAAPDAPGSAFGLVFAGYALAAVCGPLAAALIGLPAAWLVVGAPGLVGAAVLALRVRFRTGSPG